MRKDKKTRVLFSLSSHTTLAGPGLVSLNPSTNRGNLFAPPLIARSLARALSLSSGVIVTPARQCPAPCPQTPQSSSLTWETVSLTASVASLAMLPALDPTLWADLPASAATDVTEARAAPPKLDADAAAVA